LKVSRLIVAIIGLAALGLAYFTGSVLFLVVAVVAFIGGLYLMGANKKPVQKEEKNTSEKSSKQ
jgi:uncharacterized membrane protein